MLKRKVESKINYWITNENKALLVCGARQIGKTFIIRECLKASGHSFIEFNFINQKEMIDLFSNAKSANDLLLRLSLMTKEPLIKGETIIFFDEVQECKEIVTMIKFLVEEGSYKYIMSGSLLGVELNDLRSAPVGYLNILNMYPLDFKEFLEAMQIGDNIISHIKTAYTNRITVDPFIHEKILDVFYLYLIIGGMPDAVVTYLRNNNLQEVASVHENIVRLYQQDFSKYEQKNKLKLRAIYQSMASELDAKVKRYKISSIKEKGMYEQFVDDFLWLKEAGVALPVYNVSEPTVPLLLSEQRKLFKLFYSDVGLLTSFYSDYVKIKVLNKDKDINNGSLFENVVAQELVSKNFPLYYYNSKKYGELDFVIELNGKVCPIEVKSGKDYKRHSALENVLNKNNYDIDEAIVLSNYNVEVVGKRIYLPIYMIMFIENATLDNPIYKIDLQGL